MGKTKDRKINEFKSENSQNVLDINQNSCDFV